MIIIIIYIKWYTCVVYVNEKRMTLNDFLLKIEIWLLIFNKNERMKATWQNTKARNRPIIEWLGF